MHEIPGTRIVRVVGSDSEADRTIIPAGSSATIMGIFTSADGVADTVTARTGDGVTDIAFLAMAIDEDPSIEVPFIVDNGLRVVSNDRGSGLATTSITVIWRPDT